MIRKGTLQLDILLDAEERELGMCLSCMFTQYLCGAPFDGPFLARSSE